MCGCHLMYPARCWPCLTPELSRLRCLCVVNLSALCSLTVDPCLRFLLARPAYWPQLIISKSLLRALCMAVLTVKPCFVPFFTRMCPIATCATSRRLKSSHSTCFETEMHADHAACQYRFALSGGSVEEERGASDVLKTGIRRRLPPSDSLGCIMQTGKQRLGQRVHRQGGEQQWQLAAALLRSLL